MNKIYYFTGTGNSLLAAKDIAEIIGDTELLPIAAFRKDATVKVEGDHVGFFFPVYDFGLPIIVREFVQKLEIEGDPYFFAVTTMGGLAASTLPQLHKILEQKGKKLSAGFTLEMPGNYTPLYGAKPDDELDRIINSAQTRLKEISKIIKEKSTHKLETNNFFVNMIFSGILYKAFIGKMKEADKKYWVEGTCTSCGICEKICPVDNIKMESGKPTWLHHCEQCVACMQYCPVEAIQFGKKTKGRRRYKNPKIDMKEIIAQKKLS